MLACLLSSHLRRPLSSPSSLVACGAEHSVAVSQNGAPTFSFRALVPPVFTHRFPLSTSSFSHSAHHPYALTGDLYQWGKAGNFLHQRPYKISRMCESEIGSRVTSLACGHGYTAAVCSSGVVFAWGRTDKGQVGVTKGVKFIASTQVHPRLNRKPRRELQSRVALRSSPSAWSCRKTSAPCSSRAGKL